MRITGLCHGFGDLEVLDGIELEVASGEVVGIVGPSGCGKSTLLELICGLAEPRSGRAEVRGDATAAGRLEGCAYMPQRDLLFPWLSAIDNAAIAPRNQGLSKEAARETALPLFGRFGLLDFASASPDELSGGMRQRVGFLRTLLTGKPVLLLDEPFASLDAITRGEMQEWLAEAVAAEPRTVVLVTHDVEEAIYLCDRVLVLSKGPAKVVQEIRVPAPRLAGREHVVTEPAFTALREHALGALREHSR